MKHYIIIMMIVLSILIAGCTSHDYPIKADVTKDITVLNNVESDQWGSFCACSILADDGNVYTSGKTGCVKLPKGMRATVVIDEDTAKWTGYTCAIKNVIIKGELK